MRIALLGYLHDEPSDGVWSHGPPYPRVRRAHRAARCGDSGRALRARTNLCQRLPDRFWQTSMSRLTAARGGALRLESPKPSACWRSPDARIRRADSGRPNVFHRVNVKGP